MICKKFGHESWCHHQVSGKCMTFQWIKTEGPFPLSIKGLEGQGVEYQSEYGPPCECENPDLFMRHE